MMRAKVAPVKNIARFAEALESVTLAGHSDERMVLVHGATGVGKSTALAYFMNRFNAIWVEASPAWSLTSMLRAILNGIGQQPRARAAEMEEQIIQEMGAHGRPLFIDELDYIFLPGQQTSLRMLESLHSIHDKSRMPVVMVGMDKIDRKIKVREQIARRVFQWVEFNDLDREDARTAADSLCEVHIEDDLLDALFHATSGRMGRMRLGLAQIERRAKANSWDRVDTAKWGGKPWQLGR